MILKGTVISWREGDLYKFANLLKEAVTIDIGEWPWFNLDVLSASWNLSGHQKVFLIGSFSKEDGSVKKKIVAILQLSHLVRIIQFSQSTLQLDWREHRRSKDLELKI